MGTGLFGTISPEEDEMDYEMHALMGRAYSQIDSTAEEEGYE